MRLAPALLAFLSSTFVCSANGQSSHRPAAPRTSVDWPVFLSRQDLVWHRLPRGWGESVFIGNGRLGATIDEEGGAFGWSINRTDVVHDASRYPIGRVLLKTAGKITGGDARLTIWDAEGSGTVRTDSGEVHWRSFVARSSDVIAIALQGSGGERNPVLDWSPALARPPRKVHNKVPFAPEDLHPAPIVNHTADEITSVQRFIGKDAHAESIRHAAREHGAARIYYVSIGFASEPDEAVRQARSSTGAAEAKGLSRLAADEQRWWHEYLPASFVSFPDARLEAYYWIQIYKLGSAMRPDGPILDLNGPWFRDTPWPAIWWNLNIELTYSPLFRANRLGLAESLVRNLDRGRAALVANVPESLHGQAAAIGRSSGPDLVRKVDLRAATSDAAHEMGDLPWTLFYYWEYYRYQMDDRILRDRLYPLLELAIGNYLAYLEKADDGKYHLPPTESPELAVVPDASYDVALLRWGLETLIASAERLRLDDPRLPRWREVLANLTPLASDSTGLWVGRGRPWQQSHRHYSHLLAIYPLGIITPDTPPDRLLIDRSLRTWEREPSLFRGYSLTGGASMHAMLGEGDTALARLNQFLDFPKYMEPNTFYAEAGPVIETPLSAATTMQELFLQDWGHALRVFPAMPAAWQEASFDRLRADGAFLVSGVRTHGRTAWVRIESLAGQPCRLVVPDWQRAVVRGSLGKAPRVSRDSSGGFGIALAKGEWVVLAPEETTPLPDLRPVNQPAAAANRWPMLRPDGEGAEFSRRELLETERARVMKAAASYLREAPVTITAFAAPRSAGGAHDFYSEGDYWWPDPENPNGPYIRRDGETNPGNFVAHRDAMRRFSQIVPALVAAYELTGDSTYARHAVDHLRAWFVNESTRMNPNLHYAQAIKGHATGRGIGIIDTIHLVEVAQAVLVLARSGYLRGQPLADIESWFRQYLTWLTTDQYGLDERNNGNNHSVSWALQVAELARLVGDEREESAMRDFFKGVLLPEQMAPDGSFPRELARTKPYGYSLFELDLMAMLAQVLSTPNDNLWTYTTSDGRGLRRALAYMYPYVENKRSWPKPPDVMYSDLWPVRQPALLFGGLAFHEPRYIDLWKRLDPDPTVDEVIRNYPIRQPLLWFQ